MQGQKPTDSVVKVSASDFRLIAQSNEAGKKAQAKNILLQQKVDTLQKLVTGLNNRVQLKDSTISDQKKQVSLLQMVHINDAVIIGNKDKELVIANKNTEIQKRKKVAAIILGAITTGFSTYKWVTK